MTLATYYLCMPYKSGGAWYQYINATLNSTTQYYNCAFLGAKFLETNILSSILVLGSFLALSNNLA